jgi:hypothetical protein
LDRAREHANQIDLLLTDFEMPHMNGVQLATPSGSFSLGSAWFSCPARIIWKLHR